LPYTGAVLLILGAHEMGHYLACRFYRVPASLPYFIPGLPVGFGTFGAVIRIRGIIPHPRALFDIGIAGPLAGFAVTVPVLAIGVLRMEVMTPQEVADAGLALGDSLVTGALRELLRPETAGQSLLAGPVYFAGWLGVLVTALNLFPAGQLDGGHVVYALSRRLHRWTSRGTIAATLAVAAWSLVAHGSPAWIAWTVVLMIVRDRHPPVALPAPGIGHGRLAIAVVGLLVFVLCFTPVPLIPVGGDS